MPLNLLKTIAIPTGTSKNWCSANCENLYRKTARGVGGLDEVSADADKPSPHLPESATEHNSPCYTSLFNRSSRPPLVSLMLSDYLHNPRLGFTFNLNLFHPHNTFFMRRTTGNILRGCKASTFLSYHLLLPLRYSCQVTPFIHNHHSTLPPCLSIRMLLLHGRLFLPF